MPSEPLPAAVVLARLSSSRLPAKALRQVRGVPMIGYVLDRLQHCESVGRVIVATSTEGVDDPLVDYCESVGAETFRGSLDDVAGRFVDAAKHVRADWAFRANGDSPFLAVDLYDRALSVARSSSSDLVTNVHPRVLPPGASVELIRIESLEGARAEFTADDREHVTRFLYQHVERFRISQVDVSDLIDLPQTPLVVDDAEDFIRFQRIVESMDEPPWTYSTAEVLALAARRGRG